MLSMSLGDQKVKRTLKDLNVPSYPCVDVYPSTDFIISNQEPKSGAIFLSDAIWKQGQQGTITITFGTFYCNGCSTEAAWSYIGNQSNQFSSQGMPSMNLGWCDPPLSSFSMDGYTFDISDFKDATRNYCRSGQCWPGWAPGATIIHEFGHALGMMHEHQNNSQKDNPLVLNVPNITDYYINLYDGDQAAGKQAAQVNMIDRYACDSEQCDFQGSTFDTKSIMLYAIPDEWVVGENPTSPNFVLSSKDTEFLQQMYPIDSQTKPKLKVRFLDGNPWQKYWVKKVVTEQLSPKIGIDFDFDLPMGIQVTTEPPVPVTTEPPVPVTTEPPVPVTTEPPVPAPVTTEPPITIEPDITPAPIEEVVEKPKPIISPHVTGHDDYSKIQWTYSSPWYTWTRDIGYPRLQGKVPMFGDLTASKQHELRMNYFNVHPSGL